MERQYNLRSPAVKRLMKEAQELHEATETYYAQPLEDNLFEWHFTLRGPGDTEFEGGIYHGRICLPPEYPMKPPSIMLLTPNGRFETYKKICLSISGHHPESWQPSWSIRTALLAIIGFMPTHGNGAIGALDYTAEERKKLAKGSLDWKCPECGCLKDKLKPLTEASKSDEKEAKELAAQINFQAENKNAKSSASATTTSSASVPSTATPSPSTPVSSASPPSAQPAPPVPPVPPPTMPGMPPYPMFPMMPPAMFPPGMNTPGMRPPGGGMPPMMPPNPMMMMMMMRAQAMNMAMMTAAAQRAGAPLPPGPFGMPGMMPGFGMMPPGMGMMPGMMPRMGVPPTTSSLSAASVAPAASPTPTVTENIGTAAAPASVNSTSTSTTPPASSSANTPTQTSAPTTPAPSPSTPAQSASTPAPSSSTPAPLPHTPTATPTPPAAASTASPAQPTLRQRRPVPAAPTQAYGSAELPRQPVSRRSSPLILAVMVLLGISIVLLLARRLLNVNVWRFDTDF